MDAFSYLSVLISIILGLGITRLLTGLGQQIEFRDRIAGYAPAVVWALVLLVVHVQTWWAMFGLRDHAGWTFLEFLAVLLQPGVLYLLAALVLPSVELGDRVDLRAHFLDGTRWFFGLFVALLLVSVVKDLTVDGEWPEPLNLAAHAVLLTLSLGAALTKSERYHRYNTFATAAFIAVYIAVLFSSLDAVS